jgi:hypothetical protein
MLCLRFVFPIPGANRVPKMRLPWRSEQPPGFPQSGGFLFGRCFYFFALAWLATASAARFAASGSPR